MSKEQHKLLAEMEPAAVKSLSRIYSDYHSSYNEYST